MADPERCRARGYRIAGNWNGIVTGRPQSAVEVGPPAVNKVEMAGVTVQYYPPAPLPADL